MIKQIADGVFGSSLHTMTQRCHLIVISIVYLSLMFNLEEVSRLLM